MNIPNLITLFRILLVPLLVIFLIEGKRDLALLVFITAGVSDGLDGMLARLLKQKTRFGAVVDPIADKLLLMSTYVTLSVLGVLPKWLAVLVVSRDVIIVMGIGILMLNDRHVAIKPTFDSKLTTFVQLATVVFFLGYDYVQHFLYMGDYLIAATALFTVFSGLHYLIIGFAILGEPALDTGQAENHKNNDKTTD